MLSATAGPPASGLRGLRARFLLLLLGIYAVVGVLAVLGFFQVAGRIVRSLGAGYATQYANQQKANLVAKLEREVVLAQKLVNSPLLKKWSMNENDATLKALALEELESFRVLFSDHSFFYIIDSSKHYYFNNAKDEFRGKELRYTIKLGDASTAWYFATLEHVSDFALHVDNSEQLGLTNVWINAVVKDGEKKIGLGGSGLNLTEFLKEVVHSPEAGVETILVDQKGFVQGHSDQKLMEKNARIRDESQRLKVYDLVSSADRDLLKGHLDRLAAGASGLETFEINLGTRHVIVGAAYMKNIQWTAIVCVDPAQVIQSRQFLPILLLLAASLFASVFWVSYTLDRLILVRLARLTHSAREIAEGNYEVNLAVDRPDEIGQLTQSFNHMTATIRDHTHNLEHKVAARTDELQRSNVLLEESNRKVMDSIHYALLIQTALLAKPADLGRLFAQSMTYWRPRDVVGGDYYTLYNDARAGFLLAVADCTGHGVPGAFMSMASKALLDRAVARCGMDDPAALLGELHRTLQSLLQQDEPGSENGLDLALVWGSGPKLRFAAGKLNLWIQQPDGTFTVLKGDKHSLGYASVAGDIKFKNHEVELHEGQRFFLMSDGILDQSGGPKGFGLGQRRLQEALLQWKNVPLGEFNARLDELLRNYMGSHPQRDDITLIGFAFDKEPP